MDAVTVPEVLAVAAGQVQGVRVVETLRIPVGGGEYDEDGVAGRDVLAAEGERSGGEAPGGHLHRPVVAQEFLDSGLQQAALSRGEGGLQPLALPGVGEQGVRAVADEIDGGLEAREEEDEGHRGCLVLGEVLSVVGGADQAGDEVLAGAGLGRQRRTLAVDEVGEVAAHLLHRPRDAAPRAALVTDHHARPVPEVVLVLPGDAEQVADGMDGQREGVLVDQVGGAGLREAVDEAVRQLLHPGSELGHPAGREGLADQSAQPGVVRRVDVQQMGHQLGLPLPRNAGLAPGVRGLVVVRRVLGQPRVGEGLLGVGVPGDEPGLHPAGQPGPVHGGVLAQPGVGGVGVVRELPAEQLGDGPGAFAAGGDGGMPAGHPSTSRIASRYARAAARRAASGSVPSASARAARARSS